ncbi:MAG TPA: bifunctional nuclease family protein [Vicinamibacterales bacterium]|jgi:bifunctional DNase/RNase|nr:bifunctional nuclease family protein [Vicinamibacterales bacterium]
MLIEMSIKGLMIDPMTNMPIVILRDEDGQRTLPIWVGPVEANAIALQIENVAPPRPMTHDLLRNLLAGLDARLERVIISDLKDGTFYAYLELIRDGEVVFVDARPSDALALSIRTKAPVFVDTSVLDQARTVEISSDQVDRERLQRWLESLDPDDLGYKM